ncbi:MAG TPA: hypothetical protein DCR43_05315 [Bacteroidales bacterium]|nr:MAG: hypothetical protein A2X11_03880 [Bacteroidetes bacterium GWE2_42_24]OFY26100.1 MAG: hypothetical protein A2X09_11625 [Bacteroidetes bacterium GWF2_43_11]PKP23630.1 MAG: hypothetical protein CVU06_07290 [Bacteroidetes bacterium HGW-Bacteroidetes-22]HAQ65255.1 hypothetical protein [Bacteroidales bacterium]HBZ65412.1 hypothetical protein [Bacteroidales bacterium]
MQPSRLFLFLQQPTVRRGIFFLYVALITALSLVSGHDLPSVKLFRHADKVIHMCMYAGFTFLLLWGWPRLFRGSRQWLPLFVVMFWGLSMEILQDLGHYGRSFELFDLVANVLGFFPGWLAWHLIHWWRPGKG